VRLGDDAFKIAARSGSGFDLTDVRKYIFETLGSPGRQPGETGSGTDFLKKR
jgi:hypothetical protein